MMAKQKGLSLPQGAPRPNRQTAEIDLRIGKNSGFTARVETTPGGLLAIGGLVSSILLSSAVIVYAARPKAGR